MDEQTDALVQETLFRELEGKTLLTIAHRLDTILNYDRILVLDQGAVKVRNNLFRLITRPRDVCYRGSPDRMSHRKWRETKQQLI